MKLNKKGDALLAMLPVAPVPIAITAIAAMLIAYSFQPKVLANFREKKAVKMCEQSGGVDCNAMVQSWPKDQVLAYIKDDQVPGTAVNNGGNFAGGYSN